MEAFGPPAGENPSPPPPDRAGAAPTRVNASRPPPATGRSPRARGRTHTGHPPRRTNSRAPSGEHRQRPDGHADRLALLSSPTGVGRSPVYLHDDLGLVVDVVATRAPSPGCLPASEGKSVCDLDIPDVPGAPQCSRRRPARRGSLREAEIATSGWGGGRGPGAGCGPWSGRAGRPWPSDPLRRRRVDGCRGRRWCVPPWCGAARPSRGCARPRSGFAAGSRPRSRRDCAWRPPRPRWWAPEREPAPRGRRRWSGSGPRACRCAAGPPNAVTGQSSRPGVVR